VDEHTTAQLEAAAAAAAYFGLDDIAVLIGRLAVAGRDVELAQALNPMYWRLSGPTATTLRRSGMPCGAGSLRPAGVEPRLTPLAAGRVSAGRRGTGQMFDQQSHVDAAVDIGEQADPVGAQACKVEHRSVTCTGEPRRSTSGR
jgi:hypothetical protein